MAQEDRTPGTRHETDRHRVGRAWRPAEVREGSPHPEEHLGRLHPRNVRPGAVTRPDVESEVSPQAWPSWVQFVRPLPAGGVAIGRSVDRDDPFVGFDPNAAQLHIGGGSPRAQVDDRGMAQDLLQEPGE